MELTLNEEEQREGESVQEFFEQLTLEQKQLFQAYLKGFRDGWEIKENE